MAESTHYNYGLGRRKEAIATARLYTGKGEIFVGETPVDVYFGNDSFTKVVWQPLKLSGYDTKVRVSLHLKGGGKHGQAEAASLAIARALNNLSDDLRPTLKKAGLLTRDPREKERKKAGLKRARKAPQFSKR